MPRENRRQFLQKILDEAQWMITVNTIPPNTEKWLRKFYMKTMATVSAMRTSVRRTTASSQTIMWNDAYNKQLTKHDTNDDVDTMHLHFNETRGVHALRLHAHLCSTARDDTRTTHGSSPERFHHTHLHGHPWHTLLDSLLPSTSSSSSCLSPSSSSTSSCPTELLNTKCMANNPALLRCRREWGHPERLHISHRLWAQAPCLRRALRLISPLLPHDPVLGPRHGWPDTRRDAHCGTPEDKSTTAYQEACQSVSRRL